MVTRCTSWAYVAAVLLLTGVSTATAKYSGGTGEPNDPYQIATAADLIALGDEPNDYDKHFILTADIDLDPNLPGRKVFDKAVIAPDVDPCDVDRGTEGPIFTGALFTGVLDGRGHTISHLTIEGGSYLGLFGQLGYGAQVRDMGVVDADITGSGTEIGTLTGANVGGSVTRCYSSGVVSGDSDVGGLVGNNDWQGVISQCQTSGVLSGVSSVGGLVGHNGLGSSISYSCSSGSVTGASMVGGLVGGNSPGNFILAGGSITSSHSNSSVSGTYGVGGLVGSNGSPFWWGGGSITSSYSSGSVSGTSYVGGLVGYNWGSILSSFWDIQTSTTLDGVGYWPSGKGGVEGKTTAEMQTAATFLDAGWDFAGETVNGPNDIWKIAEGLDYPRLWWEPHDGRVTVVLGQVFTVALESNPSTGYRWEWVDHQDSIVEQMGEAQFKPRETGDPPLVGAGGWESFDFKAVHPGQMTLQLVYRRLWEEGVEPLKTFSLQVTVH